MSPNESERPEQPAWRTGSFCASGECLEVAAQDGFIKVRDSTRPYGGTVQWTPAKWRSFVLNIKAGRFDDIDS